MPPYQKFKSKSQEKAAFGGYLGPQMKAEAEAKARVTDYSSLPEHVGKSKSRSGSGLIHAPHAHNPKR